MEPALQIDACADPKAKLQLIYCLVLDKSAGALADLDAVPSHCDDIDLISQLLQMELHSHMVMTAVAFAI